ncbi:M14 family metallopeptidase [Bordetella pertussis]|uniref:M14 family metallopeptidase n=1 Tax=Bordetella pertussis TaxID=520 RepID=UPI00068014BA|nr:M14 family metallopeptidase [Bordetella pertussis]
MRSKENAMEFHQCYALDYHRARDKFRAAAAAAGASLTQYLHEGRTGPDGRPLHTDVARFGRADAPRRLLAISGTHGLEGFFGSAAQIGWMLGDGPASLDPDVAVIMVHAINPWGFAHLSRTTENNVDLNRNFIDHGQPHPANPDYAILHPQLLREDWSSAAVAAAQQAMEDFTARHGEDRLYDTLARGQYSHPDGLNYGGTAREWSNLTLERIVRDHLAGARKVALIDWHTGIGGDGEPFFLCFNEEGGPLHELAARWWGRDRIVGQRPHGKARPNYQGLLFHGVQALLGDVPMCGAVIEFGTRGWHMRRLLRLDLWLKFKADPASERYAMLRADLLDSFCPYDQVWREGTLRHAQEITRQAVAGLAAWTET